MKVRGIDSNGDWIIGQGLQSYKADIDALKQNIKTRIQSWRGDCFFAVDEGVDWSNYLDIGMKNVLDLDIRSVIGQTQGVLRITKYESVLDIDARKLTVDATLDTVFGEVSLEEAL